LDPAAGSLRTRRALTALASRVVLRRAEAVAVGEDGTVTLAGGELLRADAVLVCAGADTPRLVPGFDVRFSDHVRLTYAGGPAACLISPHGYGLPLGSTGRWAFGLHDSSDADVLTATRARQARLLPEILPGLDPRPVGEVRCVNVHAPWLDDGGDGWHAIRRGRAVAFMGANLMKFGPVLGDRLARTALEDGIHPDLVATLG
jgi:glycine/D-amino acid oxidase-like deaminating enzyme